MELRARARYCKDRCEAPTYILTRAGRAGDRDSGDAAAMSVSAQRVPNLFSKLAQTVRHSHTSCAPADALPPHPPDFVGTTLDLVTNCHLDPSDCEHVRHNRKLAAERLSACPALHAIYLEVEPRWWACARAPLAKLRVLRHILHERHKALPAHQSAWVMWLDADALYLLPSLQIACLPDSHVSLRRWLPSSPTIHLVASRDQPSHPILVEQWWNRAPRLHVVEERARRTARVGLGAAHAHCHAERRPQIFRVRRAERRMALPAREEVAPRSRESQQLGRGLRLLLARARAHQQFLPRASRRPTQREHSPRVDPRCATQRAAERFPHARRAPSRVHKSRRDTILVFRRAVRYSGAVGARARERLRILSSHS